MTFAEPVVAVVVAAGSGVRLGGPEPKALRPLGGRPLVWHAVRALAAGGVERAVVVVAEGLSDWYAEVLADATIPCTFVTGGATRQASVRHGLAALTMDAATDRSGIVLVHDAARPLVPAAVVTRVIEAVAGGAVAVIPVVPVVDTVRRVRADGGSELVDRATLRAVQTPQGFDRATLVAAHAAADGREFTDDAAVCEAAGHRVTLVEGSREALKVTEPTDLVVAEAILDARRTP